MSKPTKKSIIKQEALEREKYAREMQKKYLSALDLFKRESGLKDSLDRRSLFKKITALTTTTFELNKSIEYYQDQAQNAIEHMEILRRHIVGLNQRLAECMMLSEELMLKEDDCLKKQNVDEGVFTNLT